MALPYGPAGVGKARQRLRTELGARCAPHTVVDDAVLILSELLGNAYRHGRPIDDGSHAPGIRAGWSLGADGLLTLEVTDGGGPTRPQPSAPSLTSHNGRGLCIVRTLSLDWGVRERPGEVTVWAVLAVRGRHARRDGAGARLGIPTAGLGPSSDVMADVQVFGDPLGRSLGDPLRRFGGVLDDLG